MKEYRWYYISTLHEAEKIYAQEKRGVEERKTEQATCLTHEMEKKWRNKEKKYATYLPGNKQLQLDSS